MNYTVSLLTTKDDCQALIDMSKSEKESLEYRRTGLGMQRRSSNNTNVSIEADLAAVTAEVSVYETLVASLPEGAAKIENYNKLVKAQYKKFVLEQRKVNYGVITVLQKEYDLACVDKSLEEVDAFLVVLQEKFDLL